MTPRNFYIFQNAFIPLYNKGMNFLHQKYNKFNGLKTEKEEDIFNIFSNFFVTHPMKKL